MAPERQVRWRRPPRIRSPFLRYGLLIGTVVYLVVALAGLEVDLKRMAEGVDRGLAFIAAFTRPDFTSRWTDISAGMVESLAMTAAATVLGFLVSVPIAIGAARNLAPWPVYLVSRAVIAVSRGLQEVIVAIPVSYTHLTLPTITE